MKILGLGDVVDGWKLVALSAIWATFEKDGVVREMPLKSVERWLDEFPNGWRCV